MEWIGKGHNFQELEGKGTSHTSCMYYLGQGLSPFWALSVQWEAGPGDLIYHSWSMEKRQSKWGKAGIKLLVRDVLCHNELLKGLVE